MEGDSTNIKHSGVHPGRGRKTKKIISHDSRYTGRDSNSVRLEYMPEAL
jgi:hypothetical protein